GALARRFLVEAGLAGARPELGLDLVERDAAHVEHDQKVIEHVGGFGDGPLAILSDRRDRRFDRLLAELLGTMRHAPVDELARIRHVGAGLSAVAHAFLEIMECKRRHGRSFGRSLSHLHSGREDQGSSRIGSPARAMYSLAWRTEYSPKWKIEAASTALA